MKNIFTTTGVFTALIFAFFISACSSHIDQHNILSDQEKKDGWALVFDGTSTKGWHIFNKSHQRL